jgi:hypothetical protein
MLLTTILVTPLNPSYLGQVASQATSNRVPWKEYRTYPLNPMGHNVIDGKFVCPIVEGNHHGTNQSEMHQI